MSYPSHILSKKKLIELHEDVSYEDKLVKILDKECDNPILFDPLINKLNIYLLKYNSCYVNLLLNFVYFTAKNTSN